VTNFSNGATLVMASKPVVKELYFISNKLRFVVISVIHSMQKQTRCK